MNTLLVTGGAGFIGANFVHYWLKSYPADQVIVLDALTYAGNIANLKSAEQNPNFRFVKGDILQTDLVIELLTTHKVDTIVHFAAESHVDRSIHCPDAFLQTNILGTHSLLKASKQVWLEGGVEDHRFHHVSTDEVYGTLSESAPPFTESTPYAPNSPYAASKAASDHLVRAYHETYGLKVTISNCSNNYGPYHFPEKLIPLVMLNILENKPLPIYGDGGQIRDWLFVEDHARGIELVLQQGKVGENYNIGGHNEWRNIDIVQLICQLMNDAFAADAQLAQRFPAATKASTGFAQELITFVQDRPGHDRRYAIDASKSSRELGYLPKESFETGIRKTLRWYLQNESWWRSVMDGSYQQWLEQHYV